MELLLSCPARPQHRKTPRFITFDRRTTSAASYRHFRRFALTAFQSRQDFSRRTVENLQLAYEIAMQRAETRAYTNAKLMLPSYQPGDPRARAPPVHYKADDPIPFQANDPIPCQA